MSRFPTGAEFPTVTVKVPAEAVGLGAMVAVTPFGKPLAARGTLWSNPSFGTTVMVLVPLLPRAMVKVFGVALRLKVPSGFTVSEMVVEAVALPEAPLIVTVAVPFLAVSAAVNVTVVDDVAGFVLKDAVTPLGNPEAEKATVPVNPFSGVMLIVLAPLPAPCTIATPPGAEERVKAGFPTVTVRLSVVVFVNAPDVPVIVKVAAAGAAVALTVKVSVLLVVAGFGLNAAATPFGSPDTVRVTFPLKPPWGMMAIALVPLLPWMIDNAPGVAARVKPGAGAGQLLTRLAAFTVPIPVAKSQPVVAT